MTEPPPPSSAVCRTPHPSYLSCAELTPLQFIHEQNYYLGVLLVSPRHCHCTHPLIISSPGIVKQCSRSIVEPSTVAFFCASLSPNSNVADAHCHQCPSSLPVNTDARPRRYLLPPLLRHRRCHTQTRLWEIGVCGSKLMPTLPSKFYRQEHQVQQPS